jgi:hypothetical protein
VDPGRPGTDYREYRSVLSYTRQSSESLKGDRWAPKILLKYRFDNKWTLMYNVLYAEKSATLFKI